MLEAFLLTRGCRQTRAGLSLEYWGSSPRGPVCVRVPGQASVCFAERAQLDRLDPSVLAKLGRVARRKQVALRSLRGELVDALAFDSPKELRQAHARLREQGLELLEADVKPEDRFLMERFVTGGCRIDGELVQREGYLEATVRTLEPSIYTPTLRALSLDLETDGFSGPILSIAMTLGDEARVLMVGEPFEGAPEHTSFHADEAALLRAFVEAFVTLDPDVVIGWNVIDFDFTVLVQRSETLGVPLSLGRDGSTCRMSSGNTPRVRVAGRVVLCGIETLRAQSAYFESYALEDVAQAMLGRGKAIDHASGDRLAELRRMHREDRAAFARYNLEDCALVQEIFAHADLLGFLVERKQLTGLPFDRPRGAVAAFDYLYLPRLHREGFVAESVREDEELGTSPGGYVMDSQPGLFDNVIVLDFKSLYPSIIRTFAIDPLGRALAALAGDADPTCIPGFDGAFFDRKRHILPALLTTLWKARDEAKRKEDAARSQAIKILMNSFYGVLGTPGCRFHSAQLTSSITRRGHEIITESAARLRAQGLTVIYGDTDSLFVLLGAEHDDAACRAHGARLASELNAFWRDELLRRYGIESQLELQFDTHYARFFMPSLRDSERGSKKRYAGLMRSAGPQGTSEHVVFKGLEAVRTDWTPLARRFQRELYRRIFVGERYDDYVREVRAQLMSGALDTELVYRKRLRRPLDEYVKNVPPHVKAARMRDDPSARVVSYVMTKEGPVPMDVPVHASASRARPDYAHYLSRQLAPAADAILGYCGTSFEALSGTQLRLF